MQPHNGEHEQSDLKIGLVGLALSMVWILIVSAFAYWLAAGH
jgi:hypothetical protein